MLLGFLTAEASISSLVSSHGTTPVIRECFTCAATARDGSSSPASPCYSLTPIQHPTSFSELSCVFAAGSCRSFSVARNFLQSLKESPGRSTLTEGAVHQDVMRCFSHLNHTSMKPATLKTPRLPTHSFIHSLFLEKCNAARCTLIARCFCHVAATASRSG